MLPVVAPDLREFPDLGSEAANPVTVTSWKERKNRPSRRALRLVRRLLLLAAAGYAVWFAWNWIMGDTFDVDPATAPNAYEALDTRFAVQHPVSGAQIEVRADLASRQGIAVSGDVAVGRRDDGLFVREGSDDWRIIADEELSALAPLVDAIDAARVMTIDMVFPQTGWTSLDIVDRVSRTVDGPDFTARQLFDVSMLSEPAAADRSFPIPRLEVNTLGTPVAVTALTLDADIDTIHPEVASRLGLTETGRFEVVIDDVGVIHSIQTIDQLSGGRESAYLLLDAAIERPRPFEGTGLEDVPRAAPLAAQLDLDMASREAIGPLRFERIVDQTGVTLDWGNTDRRNYDAVATWRDSGSQMTMNIVVSGFRRDGRDDLLAHELAHVAAFGIGIFDGSHECLADIVASHWLGHKVNMGAYDYMRCESHGDAQRVLETYE